MFKLKFKTMITSFIVSLTRENTSLELVSTKNNYVLTFTDVFGLSGYASGTGVKFVITKKYFNQLLKGGVEGRLRFADDIYIFEGFNFL
jgi:hypothetical protein